MMARDVGMNADLSSHHRGRDTRRLNVASRLRVLPCHQVDRTPGGVTECVGDGRHGGGECGPRTHLAAILPTPVVQIPRGVATLGCHELPRRHGRPDRRGTSPGRGPRVAPLDRRSRHAARRVDHGQRRRRRADCPHRPRVSTEGRDHSPRVRGSYPTRRRRVDRSRVHGDERRRP